MKIKKIYSYSDKKQIWRILISETGKLIIETRDTEKKEVFFHVLDLFKGKKFIKKYQPGEKYWIGIETTFKDLIYFHKYAKPDMPGHKVLMVFDMNSKKILWENDTSVYLFMSEKGVVVYEQKLTGNKYSLLDHDTGKKIDQLNIDENNISEMMDKHERKEDYSNYRFPQRINMKETEIIEDSLIKNMESETNSLDIVGDVEYVKYGSSVFFNFHYKVTDEILENRLVVKSLKTGTNILSEKINSTLNAFAPDSFFIYKNLLLYLKEKNEIVVCNISEE